MSEVITLDLKTVPVKYLCQKDERLAKLITMVGPISYIPKTESAYPFLIHEIIEQMLSIKAGQKIYDRLEYLCDGNITPSKVNALSISQLHNIGTSNAKAEYIHNVTTAITDGRLCLETLETMSDQEVINTLTNIRGIGCWTAKMYLLFVLDRPDVLPFEDGAFLQVYRWLYKTNDCTEKAISKKCEKWKPYSSVASRFFYKALNSGMTKEEFHLFK